MPIKNTIIISINAKASANVFKVVFEKNAGRIAFGHANHRKITKIVLNKEIQAATILKKSFFILMYLRIIAEMGVYAKLKSCARLRKIGCGYFIR